MFSKLSLKVKLLSLCLLLAVMTGAVGAVGIYVTKSIVDNFSYLANNRLQNTLSIARARSEFRKQRIHLTILGLEGISPQAIEDNIKEIEIAKERYESFAKKYSEVTPAEGERDIYAPLPKAWDEVLKISSEIVKLSKSTSEEDRKKLVHLLTVDYNKVADEFNAATTKLIDFLDKGGDAAEEAAREAQGTGTFLNIAMSVAAFGLAVVLGFIFSTSLANLLRGLADSLSGGATEVAAASNQISQAGAELSASATEQAAALQQTVSSIDEVSSMITKNAENAKRSLEVSTTSQQAADRGKGAVDQMLRSIEDINNSNTDIMQQTEASNAEIANIVKVIGEIGNKTKVINDIVFQTKLLSFNASVEAARAGEHGKGFAVVAEEVGNLAQMSGNAAKDISKMLEESIQKVEKTVSDSKTRIERLIVTGKEKVEAGMVTAKRCGDALEEIVRNVSDLNHMIGEISTASQEQAQGVQEITRAMGQLDQVTQQNASASQQSASAAEELNGQASSLHTLVNTLVQTIQGGEMPTAAVHHTKAADAKMAKVVQFKKKAPKITQSMSSMASVQKMAVGGQRDAIRK